MVGVHASARVRPSFPRTRSMIGGSVTWKPVAKMIVSTSWRTPSTPTTPVGSTRWTFSVTTSTLLRASDAQ